MKKKALKNKNPPDSKKDGTLVFYADSVADDDGDDENEIPGENSDKNSGGLQDDPSGHDKKDDWELAIRYRDLQRFGHIEPKVKKELGARAIRSIIERARLAMGPVQKPYHYFGTSENQAHDLISQGAVLEIDIEETLQNYLGDRSVLDTEIFFQARMDKNHGLVLLLDTSLSMKGEKLALLGVALASVAAIIPSPALCVLGFDSEIHVIKEFSEEIELENLISRILSIPPGGFTNIELGLNVARAHVQKSKYQRARVILISDGRFTEGKHPALAARHFSFLYPVKIGKDPSGREVMSEIAATGLGRMSEVREMSQLPRFLFNAIRTWVK